MPDALHKAWCWPGLGFCIHTGMQKRQAAGCRLATTIWTLSCGQPYMLDVCLACLDGLALCLICWDPEGGGAMCGLTPEIPELLNITDFSPSFPNRPTKAILTCLSCWVGTVRSSAPPTFPTRPYLFPKSSFSGSIFTSLKQTHTAQVACRIFGSAQLSRIRAIAMICTILRFELLHFSVFCLLCQNHLGSV